MGCRLRLLITECICLKGMCAGIAHSADIGSLERVGSSVLSVIPLIQFRAAVCKLSGIRAEGAPRRVALAAAICAGQAAATHDN